MKWIRASVVLFFMALAPDLMASGAFAFNGVPEGTSFDAFAFSGPKMKDLYFVVTREPDAQFRAMLSGELDVLSDLYSSKDIERLAKSEKIRLSSAKTFHAFFITFNTRKFPWDQKELRQAASQVMDRKRWTRDLFSGYAEPLTGYLPPVSPYCEPATDPLPFGVKAARERLAAAGWTWNRFGWLVAPDGREVPLTRLLCPPSSVAATTTEMAQLAAEALNGIGIPVEVEPVDYQTMLTRVDDARFDACTNAWSMSRDPDVLYAFYHSSMDVTGGYNMSGIADPELDRALLELRNAPDEPSARKAASLAQRLLSDLTPCIPIYSRYLVSATRANWDGVFSTDRTASDNLFTLLSMTPKEGGERPIYWNLPEDIRTLNPFLAFTNYDWTVLGVIFDSLISVNPYTFGDISWLAESWSIQTEKREGKDRSVLTFTLRPDLKWQDGAPLTADDVKYTFLYIRAHKIPRFYDATRDIEDIRVEADGRTLTIRMANASYWHLHNIGGLIILPRHILEKVPDWRTWRPDTRFHKAPDGTNETLTELIGSGPYVFRESRTGEYVHMTRNAHYMLRKIVK